MWTKRMFIFEKKINWIYIKLVGIFLLQKEKVNHDNSDFDMISIYKTTSVDSGEILSSENWDNYFRGHL